MVCSHSNTFFMKKSVGYIGFFVDQIAKHHNTEWMLIPIETMTVTVPVRRLQKKTFEVKHTKKRYE